MNYVSGYYNYYYHYSNTLSIIAALYLPTIFTIKWYMSDKQPLRSTFYNKLLGVWNLFLGISSGIGAYYYLVPFIIHDIQENGLNSSICIGKYMNDDLVTHIVILFNFSKFLEFVDTLFIVSRKSHLDFLHYYHHIVTCIYCWVGGYLQITTGVYFAGINLFVHAIMYSYYALVAFDLNIFYKYRKYITIIQITQMFAGIYVICSWLYNCTNDSIYHIIHHVAGLVMYMSYAYLFSKLFFAPKPIKDSKPLLKTE